MSQLDPITTEIIDVASTLINFESAPDNHHGIDECYHWISEYLSQSDPIHLKHFRCSNVPSVVASLNHSRSPDVLLLGHFDVVAGKPEQFNPRIINDQLYGRGAIDMKGADAVMMVLLRQLAKLSNPPKVALGLTGDEETGGFNGAGYLAGKQQYRPTLLVAPDGGASDSWSVIYSEKGVHEFVVTARGKAAHSAYLWEGENAIDKLLTAYQNFQAEFPAPDVSKGYWHPTCNLSWIRGGDSDNVVPAEAQLCLNIRVTDAKHHTWIDDLVKKHFKHCEISRMRQQEPSVATADNPIVTTFSSLIEAQSRQPVEIRRSHGTSDWRHFAEHGCPGVVIQAIGGDIHGPREWVSIPSLRTLYDVLWDFITNKRTNV